MRATLQIPETTSPRKPIQTARTTPDLTAPEVQEAIRVRAYELYQQRAGALGSADDDWLAAEREILASLSKPAA